MYGRWKAILVLGIVSLSLWSLYPPTEKINLGLDLQGGMHLILEVDTSKLPEDVPLSEAVERALIVIRNRIDEFGVREPLIQKQGESWIAVQLPGIEDPQRAIDLIGKTALLEFKLVDEEGDLESARLAKENIPPGSEILYDKKREAYLLKKEALLTGAAISLARVEIGEYGRPHIALEFNKSGAARFARITRRHIGERLAIVLDDIVHSAPVIRTEITGGKAVIEGNFSMEEAGDLSIVLKVGSLPAPVQIIEKRLVGPSLGEDSIKKGIFAILLGSLFVFVFLAIYYKISGLIADLAIMINLIILLGSLAAFQATLTLPGIAGIILTIGIAVDAHILIFERIKEELREGKSPRSAALAGFSRALPAIVDANITTLIVALLLFQFGTGSVKGFAVTLSMGILVSMFTSLIITRFIFEGAVPRQAERLSI